MTALLPLFRRVRCRTVLDELWTCVAFLVGTVHKLDGNPTNYSEIPLTHATE